MRNFYFYFKFANFKTATERFNIAKSVSDYVGMLNRILFLFGILFYIRSIDVFKYTKYDEFGNIIYFSILYMKYILFIPLIVSIHSFAMLTSIIMEEGFQIYSEDDGMFLFYFKWIIKKIWDAFCISIILASFISTTFLMYISVHADVKNFTLWDFIPK